MNMLRHFSEEPLTGAPRTISIVAAVMLLIYLWITRVRGRKK
jgi:hypothetical protein